MTREELKRLGLKSRIITELRLDKISAVADPCVEGATMAIMKFRREPDATTIVKQRRSAVLDGSRFDASDLFAGYDLDDPSTWGVPEHEALRALKSRGFDPSRLTPDQRETVTVRFDAGRRTTIGDRHNRFAYVVQKGCDTLRYELGDNNELIAPGPPVGKRERLHDEIKPAHEYDDEGEPEMYDEFMSEVTKVAARDGISTTAALDKVRKSRPELFEKYQNATPKPRTSHPSTQRVEKSAAAVRFEDKISEVAKARQIPWTQAADIVRRADPEGFRAAYR